MEKRKGPAPFGYGFLALTISLACSILIPDAIAQTVPTVAFVGGHWFNGRSFENKTGYAVGDRLTFRRPANVDRAVDLHQGFVIPPFGEAHNHNVETLNKVRTLVATYLRHGIFYVKNPNNLARDRDVLRPMLNLPDTIDLAFANGSLTGSGGHPIEIPERVIRTGKWTTADAEGGFYYTVDNESDLEKKWPILLGTHPDFIKTYLLYSDQYSRRRDNTHFYAWKGLDPNLLKAIVKMAHAAGLRVSTHIEDAADFHNALMAGVDEINHMPGFRSGSDVEKHAITEFEISEADARLAAKHQTFVVTTLSAGALQLEASQRTEQDQLNAKNLRLLLQHHVHLALGSDAYRSDTLPEALYINSLHVMDSATLLNIWSTFTAETIFPRRKIGLLKEGYEASFLVLGANPIENFAAVEQITLSVKQGHVFDPAKLSNDAANRAQ
jgi:hypothetical protein